MNRQKLLVYGTVIVIAGMLGAGIGGLAHWAWATACGDLIWVEDANFKLGVEPVYQNPYWFHYNQFKIKNDEADLQTVYVTMDTSESYNIAGAYFSDSGSGYNYITGETVRTVDVASGATQTLYFKSYNSDSNEDGNLVVKFTTTGEKYKYIGWQTCDAP